MGVVFVSPQNYGIPRAFSLTEPCSNNVVEYNALLIGMQIVDVARQQNAHADALASLAASLALPAGVVEKILVYNHDLYLSLIHI